MYFKNKQELLTYIHYILNMEINTKSKTYEHTIQEAGESETIEVNREQHLEEVMRWAAQEIEKHFELTPEPTIEQPN
ncbi:type II toxin-antitoxin system antitoxin, TscA family [Staphylococcus coagulans]|uniref:TscA family type II toxin-antitoxin system antitoxin n=1 Tax=Staphylococcus coagulans TaxID=74706 RepID=UPI001BE7C40E|nr:pathogenicity island protein [Staphylococcus coagulans]MBT2818533.1 pathogenicity island protein [Staphylococcus coagulans]